MNIQATNLYRTTIFYYTRWLNSSPSKKSHFPAPTSSTPPPNPPPKKKKRKKKEKKKEAILLQHSNLLVTEIETVDKETIFHKILFISSLFSVQFFWFLVRDRCWLNCPVYFSFTYKFLKFKLIICFLVTSWKLPS